jgi:hypothetical protein
VYNSTTTIERKAVSKAILALAWIKSSQKSKASTVARGAWTITKQSTHQPQQQGSTTPAGLVVSMAEERQNGHNFHKNG